ncbi:MAG: helix-turn-helix domain-containing protein [Planctomycetota bacterium]
MSVNDLGPFLDELHEEFKDDPVYRAECLYNDITAQILDHMRANDISRAELARRMNVSEAYVSRLFGETRNFTLETLGKLAVALGIELDIRLRKERSAMQPQDGSAAKWPNKAAKKNRLIVFEKALSRGQWAPGEDNIPDESRSLGATA